jgi:hypothetical protein
VLRDAYAKLSLDRGDKAAHLARSYIEEAMAGLAVEPMPMGGLEGDVISLDSMFRAIEDERLQVSAVLQIMEGSVDRSLIADAC